MGNCHQHIYRCTGCGTESTQAARGVRCPAPCQTCEERVTTWERVEKRAPESGGASGD